MASTPNTTNDRRVVITGVGLISPIGDSADALWESLVAGRSGVAASDRFPQDATSPRFAAEAHTFSGKIDDFGPLTKETKKAIRKGLKLMCRETQMAVAAAQLALTDAGYGAEDAAPDPERSGVVLGSDYMLTLPQDFVGGMAKCTENGPFSLDIWGEEGLDEVEPLWMLKYLPNMPASHIAIFNDLRGPNNSLTMREASGLMAVGEALRTIARGHADRMVAGATGTRIMPMQAIHTLQSDRLALGDIDPVKASRPFDTNAAGMVCGEGAGMLVLETLESAQARGAEVYGEVVGFGSSQVSTHNPETNQLVGRNDVAIAQALKAALRDADWTADRLGHVNAHGIGAPDADRQEAEGLRAALGDAAGATPVFAPKSYFGNLGAGGGVVELVASLLATRHGELPRTLNCEDPSADCPIRVATEGGVAPGDRFATVNTTPQGQAAAVCVAQTG
ncbi:3-oxoacyl-[acyl-carrier-protein] synthase 2 [Pseudobythopirellula maris]|uniref:3-oxoacyl-[acyl-carrier-protein] synthase 2 n=1 Tax=Pseudobythopirellula maris TaxID=2527991 RepID=A0A5C5ZID3_9BACT|nr:beta-ketoacyl-[acyl-carrier-protein] synthase family protein [Pseudobythopirellula maris]TWT86303.1 3-oxoacyl-[acyl-carrier-protein] synthase 2 [Pseudobythopirellula maris]